VRKRGKVRIREILKVARGSLEYRLQPALLLKKRRLKPVLRTKTLRLDLKEVTGRIS